MVSPTALPCSCGHIHSGHIKQKEAMNANSVMLIFLDSTRYREDPAWPPGQKSPGGCALLVFKPNHMAVSVKICKFWKQSEKRWISNHSLLNLESIVLFKITIASSTDSLCQWVQNGKHLFHSAHYALWFPNLSAISSLQDPFSSVWKKAFLFNFVEKKTKQKAKKARRPFLHVGTSL